LHHFKKMFTYSKKEFNWQTKYEGEYIIRDDDNYPLNDVLDFHRLTLTLVEAEIKIPKNPKYTVDFTVDHGDHIQLEYTKHKAAISFYNYATQCNLYGKFQELDELKGKGHEVLKSLLEVAIKDQLITVGDEVIITAEGKIKGTMDHKKGMQKLLAYLEKLGFTQLFPEHYELALNNGYVPMVAKVKSILEYKEWCDSATL